MRIVPLSGKKAAGRSALVDDGDYDLVSRYHWCARETACTTYAQTNIVRDGRRSTLLMHILIMGLSGIDHINHDGLDNQRLNLRPATVLENSRNARKLREATSSFKGVTARRRGARVVYQARIRVNGATRSLGVFDSEKDAARAYDNCARQEFGEFAYFNFPDSSAVPGQPRSSRLAVDDAPIVAMRVAGATFTAIGDELGITATTARRRFYATTGIKVPTLRREAPPEAVAALRASGMSFVDIGVCMGISPDTAAVRYREATGEHPRPHPYAVPDSLIVQLRDDGLSFAVIAERVGMSAPGVRFRYRKATDGVTSGLASEAT